jgi:AraC-like DNA-binding protein
MERLEFLNGSQVDHRFYDCALKIAEDNLAKNSFNVNEMSHILGISRVTLYRKIKRLSGCSASEFIRITRLIHARRLLEEGGLNVTEAARCSGFHNPSYFSKRFKEYFGRKPSEVIQM